MSTLNRTLKNTSNPHLNHCLTIQPNFNNFFTPISPTFTEKNPNFLLK
jgi:hypothetical protein